MTHDRQSLVRIFCVLLACIFLPATCLASETEWTAASTESTISPDDAPASFAEAAGLSEPTPAATPTFLAKPTTPDEDASAFVEPTATVQPTSAAVETVPDEATPLPEPTANVYARILRDETPLYADAEMTQVVAVAHADDRLRVIEIGDAVVCVAYAEQEQTEVCVYIPLSEIDFLPAEDSEPESSDEPTATETPLPEDTPAAEADSDSNLSEVATPGASGSGSFCIMARTQSQLVIVPTTVHYAAGDTILSALGKLNGHSVYDLETGEISRIDGVEGNYSRRDENGDYDLGRAASEIRVMVFVEGDFDLTQAQADLICVMASYLENADARDDENASAIYQEILERYLSLSDADAAAYAERLNRAMAQDELPVGDENAPEQVDGWYQISTGGEMKWFADLVNGKLEDTPQNAAANARLVSSISLSGMEWTPVGSENAPYSGTFDGGDHSISGLRISSNENYQALFGYVGAQGTVKNLTVSGSVDVSGSYSAGIIAFCAGNVSDLHNRCSVVSSGQYVGGVIGAFSDKHCTAKGCSNSGSIYCSNGSGSNYVGGILGGKVGILSDCRNTGDVMGYSNVGGVAGQATEVIDCQNSGNIQFVKQYGGGIAGQTVTATGCKNDGRITATGVFIELRARYEASYIGGIAGAASTVTRCTNHGAIESRAAKNCHFSSAAGVAGKATNAADCINNAPVTISGSYIAGVIGGNGGGSIVRCANHAAITNQANSGEQTGGVASAGKLEQCYNTGVVIGYASVGGVVGGTSASTVKRSYNLAAISGETNVGGVAGVCLSASDCYNVGSVSLGGSGGGLIAAKYSSVTNCCYLNALSLYSKAGTAMDREALRLCMRDVSSYVLNLNEGYHEGYPCLEWEDADTSAHVESISLKDGEKDRFAMVCGGELPRLPAEVLVSVGGLSFPCDATWTPPADFDKNCAGEYIFTPNADLPGRCSVDGSTQTATVTVSVVSESDLPVLTQIALPEDTATEYTTGYGQTPEGFPSDAIAVIDGVQQRIAISWQAPENLDLTDTSSEFIYTLHLEEACAIAEGVELPTISLRVLPMMLVDSMRFTQKSSAESGAYDLEYLGMEVVDGAETFRYRLNILDSSSAAYLHISPNALYSDTVAMQYSYTALTSNPVQRTGTLSFEKSNTLSGFVAGSRAYTAENTLTITAQAGDVQQIYLVETCIQPTLGSLQVFNGDTSNYISPEFDGAWFDYSTQIPNGVESVTLKMTSALSAGILKDLTVSVGGSALEPDEDGSYCLPLAIAGDETQTEITVAWQNDKGETRQSVYHLRIERLQESLLTLTLSPEDAIFTISNKFTGSVFANADGSYSLIRSYDYSYTASAYGYVSQSGSFTASDAEIALDIALLKADENDAIDEDMTSEWDNFRGNENNNAVSGSATPISASDAVLYWANQAGISYGSDAVSSPILVNSYLICTAKQNIFKIDVVTGEIVQIGDMIKKSNFNITPPTYAKGMIFAALADGTIQAFNADTLESLWVYTDPLGGQPNSPITYRNGYIYTGFWNGESDDGNWVCLSITDEDPTRNNEAKKAAWTYSQKGGFYWAGAYVSGKFMLVGTDDGETGYTSATSNLLSLDPDTGRLIDCLSGLDADIRCSICYDSATDRYYFTSKGGYFYSVAVSADGYFDRSSLKKLDLRNGRDIEGMSTSTPVVYNGRAYVGYSGAAQFQAYSGHGIAVIDLKSWSIAYTCPTKGYPQTSGLLTTAYENTGLVYIYFFENVSPGSLRIIRDCPGQTQLLSIYDASPIDEAEILFTPRGAQRQYVLCSPIVDEYGTIYFKNDSGFMMAVGSGISSLEVVQKPNKLLYEEGETFDASGLQVIAHLANGCSRDVSAYITYSQEPLTAADTDVTVYFDHVKYNNEHEYLDRPETVVNLTVLSSEEMASLRSVVDQINALGKITIESGDTIASARRDYDALAIALQELVSNYEILTRAEEEYDLLVKAEKLSAERVDRYIASIGEVTLDSADSIRSAFEIYDALSDYGRSLVQNYALLLDYQAQYQALVEASNARAAAVIHAISALGEITLDSGSDILAAREAYDALSESERALVTNLSTLEAAEATYAELVLAQGASIQQTEELIAAIGEVTLEREPMILRAREAYDALEESAKEQVSNYDKLLEAEEQLRLLKERLAALEEVIAQLDAQCALLRSICTTPSAVTANCAADVAVQIHQMEQLLQAQTAEDQSLLQDYFEIVDQYQIAVASVVHTDEAMGISCDGLAWHQQIRAEVLSSSKDTDYASYRSLVAPRRVLKLYRVTILDLITGKQATNHASLSLKWTIPTPKYNDSAYSTVGIAFVGADAAVSYPDSSYANHKQNLRFTTKGDGLIGFVGTKVEMSASGSVAGSGSVLGGSQGSSVTGSGSVLSGAQHSSPQHGSSGTVSSLKTHSYSAAQSALIESYGEAVTSGVWEYQNTVIQPALLAQLTDAQVKLYAAMSEAVETGTNRFFAYAVTNEEFEAVEQVYQLCNPLSCLAEFSLVPEEGMVEVEYLLSEEDHLTAISNWQDQISMIVNACLVQGAACQTAAQLYQTLTTRWTFPEETADGEPWQPEEAQPLSALYPSAFYAMMENIASVNDAAQAYAYLLMQVGTECILVQQTTEDPEQPAHLWVVQNIDEQWGHADPEMDLYNSRNSDADANARGHFGMDDEQRVAEFGAEIVWEMRIPERMRLDAQDSEAEPSPFEVPACTGNSSGYAVEETVVILNGEEE